MEMLKKGTISVPSMPKALNMYSDFIIKNASAVSQIESGLRSLTYVIPGRFLLARAKLHPFADNLRSLS